MSNLAEFLKKTADDRGINNTQLGNSFGLHRTVMSRILADKQPLGSGTIARMLVSLNNEEARQLLESYFLDELESIKASRIRHAEMGRGELVEEDFRFTIQVKTKRK